MSDKVLWTRQPRRETIEAAEELNIDLVVMPALEVATISDKASILAFMADASQLVITSMHAVTSMIEHDCINVLRSLPVITLTGNTNVQIKRLGGTVIATSSSARELQHVLCNHNSQRTRYLCGECIMHDLGVPRLAIYKTRSIHPIVPDVEATALFSPSSAASILTPVNQGRLGILGAIGPSTAKAMLALGAIPHVVSSHANETTLLRQLVKHLKQL